MGWEKAKINTSFLERNKGYLVARWSYAGKQWIWTKELLKHVQLSQEDLTSIQKYQNNANKLHMIPKTTTGSCEMYTQNYAWTNPCNLFMFVNRPLPFFPSTISQPFSLNKLQHMELPREKWDHKSVEISKEKKQNVSSHFQNILSIHNKGVLSSSSHTGDCIPSCWPSPPLVCHRQIHFGNWSYFSMSMDLTWGPLTQHLSVRTSASSAGDPCLLYPFKDKGL